MNEVKTEKNLEHSEALSSEGVNWSQYATSYDEFVVPLSCYQDNINRLCEFLREKEAKLTDQPIVCDLGGGTGIYIKAMSQVLGTSRFIHIDYDEEMCRYAEQRYSKSNLKVKILNVPAKDAGITENSLDLVTSINVIYALPDPLGNLKDVYRWLKPGGYFFTIDFGRRQNTLDWGPYFFKELIRRKGFLEAAKAVPAAINLFQRQNEGVAAQDEGAYWLHSGREFREALENIGFLVEKSAECYRGYADLAVCRKPA